MEANSPRWTQHRSGRTRQNRPTLQLLSEPLAQGLIGGRENHAADGRQRRNRDRQQKSDK